MELPFGLILKWSDRTRMEEAIAMQMARAAGMPVPKVLCCGEHPQTPFRLISILMTRLPGLPLENSNDPLEVDEEGPWLDELGRCFARDARMEESIQWEAYLFSSGYIHLKPTCSRA